MDVTELVESRWLTAQDVKESPTKTVVILNAGNLEEATNPKGEHYKVIVCQVQIDGKTKDWRINRASLKKMISIKGKETSAWIGQPILLTTMLMQGGKEAITPA